MNFYSYPQQKRRL